jgi:hypothetical protein
MKPVCMSSSLKKVLQGCRFGLNDKDVKAAVVQQFFGDGELSPASMPMGIIFHGFTSFEQNNPQRFYLADLHISLRFNFLHHVLLNNKADTMKCLK